MLKLYPADSNAVFEVAHINRDNTFVRHSALSMTLGNDAEGATGESWSYNRAETVPFALPLEVGDEFGEYLYNAIFDDRSVDLYLDKNRSIPSGIGMTLISYGTFQGNYRAVAFYFNGANGEIQNGTDERVYFSQFRVSGTNAPNQLASIYSCPDSLSSNTEEMKYFIRKMIETEVMMEKGEIETLNCAQTPLFHPFVPIKNDLVSFTYMASSIDVTIFTYQHKLGSNFLQFINAPSMYYAFTGRRIINVDKMKIGKLGYEFYPAVAYNPSSIDINTFRYSYGNGTLLSEAGSSRIVNTNIKINNYDANGTYSGDFSTVNVKSYNVADICFVQIPSRTFSHDEIRAGQSRNENLNSSDYVSNSNTGDQFYIQNPRNFNFANIDNEQGSASGNYDRYWYFTQYDDVQNMSYHCSLIGDSDELTYRFNKGELDFPSFGGGGRSIFPDSMRSKGMTSFVYGVEEDIGTFTGNDVLDFFYGGEVQEWDYEDDPPVIPEIPPEIPDDGGDGGIGDDSTQGGDGTWSAPRDDTSNWDGPPSQNPIAPMPMSLGLDGNYKLLKMNRGDVKSLADQAWTEDGWLKHIASVQGASRIGEGVIDFKVCFANIPTDTSFSLTKIGGYEISNPISCSIAQQYTNFNFGTINVPKFFGSYLDYAPFTDFVLELPFAEPVKIPPELIVGDVLKLMLNIDALSGTGLYMISNSKELITQVPCDVFVSIPFGTSEYTSSRVQAVFSAISSIATGAVVGTSIGGGIAGGVAGAVSGLAKESVNQENSRNISLISDGGSPSATGAMGIKKAILKTSRPYVKIPSKYYQMVGAPSGAIRKLGSCTGFFSVDTLYGTIPCNDDEYNEIVRQLSDGVIP